MQDFKGFVGGRTGGRKRAGDAKHTEGAKRVEDAKYTEDVARAEGAKCKLAKASL